MFKGEWSAVGVCQGRHSISSLRLPWCRCSGAARTSNRHQNCKRTWCYHRTSLASMEPTSMLPITHVKFQILARDIAQDTTQEICVIKGYWVPLFGLGPPLNLAWMCLHWLCAKQNTEKYENDVIVSVLGLCRVAVSSFLSPPKKRGFAVTSTWIALNSKIATWKNWICWRVGRKARTQWWAG